MKFFLFTLSLLFFASSQLNARPDHLIESAKRIGYFSGTFDPPHRGHENAVQKAIEQLNLDFVYVIPNFHPEHKPLALEFAEREEMTLAAFQDIPKVIVANEAMSREMDQIGVTKQLQLLAKTFRDKMIYQIMGLDSLDRLIDYDVNYPKNVAIAVGRRSPQDKIDIKRFRGINIIEIEDKNPPTISSTSIRESIEKGQYPGSKIINPAVLQIIKDKGYYRCENVLKQSSAK